MKTSKQFIWTVMLKANRSSCNWSLWRCTPQQWHHWTRPG